ncbi:MAG TPA: chemotaxis protein CheX, partial [Phycisphaerae bacterium]|nr:chemotaxis protein CheX [Phycisphaerae bacterium]
MNMQSIDIKYINPFLIAAKSICGDSLKMPPVIGKPRLLEEGERLWKSFQISAVVRLSNAVQGDVLVSFSERVAIVLASQLVGEHFETVDDFCRDALGEIANLIVGTAKRSLPTGLVAISPPEIVHTRDFVFPP